MYFIQRILVLAIFLILISCNKDNGIDQNSRFKVSVDGRANIYIIDDQSNSLVKQLNNKLGNVSVHNFYLNSETNNLYFSKGDKSSPIERVNILDVLQNENNQYSSEGVPFPLQLGWSVEELVVDKNENIHAFIIDTSPNGNEVFYQKSFGNELIMNIDLTQEFGIPMRGIEGAYYLEKSNQIYVVWYDGRISFTPPKGLIIDIDSNSIELLDFPDIDIVNIFENNSVTYLVGGNIYSGDFSLSLFDLNGSELCPLIGILVQPTYPSAAIRYDIHDSRIEFIERNGSNYNTGFFESENCQIIRDDTFYSDNETFFVNLYFFNN
tara:strand:- start:3857 stop:4825 length:969 start_codon:yes stop_codon:yes gene_type:complete